MSPTDSAHPWLSRGACCVSFRVDFALHAMQQMGGTVHNHPAVDVNGSTCSMRGAEQVPIRCMAADWPGGRAGRMLHLCAAPNPLPRFHGGRLRMPQGARGMG